MEEVITVIDGRRRLLEVISERFLVKIINRVHDETTKTENYLPARITAGVCCKIPSTPQRT